jgi:ribosomal protein S18 acetylase RimI-like enzyme
MFGPAQEFPPAIAYRRFAASSAHPFHATRSRRWFVQSEVATASDAKPLADLVNAAYRGIGGRHGWTHEAELISGARARSKDIAAMIGDSSTTMLLRRGGNPPALLGCIAIEMNSATDCTISMLAVAPGFQAAGLGRALLEDAEQLAVGRGAATATITVVEQRQALIAWYERRGYRRTGAHEAFPYGDDSVGTPLRVDLRFVVLEKRL